MRAASRLSIRLGAAGLLLAVAACATSPPASDPEALAQFKQTDDPLEPTNRVVYRVNDAVDTAVIRPAAQAYRFVLPAPVRNSVHNVLVNLGTPVVLSNDMLEGKPRRAGDTSMRFLINSTVGVAGLFDVASEWGYPAHQSSFGTTLALWGVPDGPYLYLPVVGPSDPRDAAGFGVDVAIDPFTWVGRGLVVQVLTWSRYGISALDTRERVLDPIDQIKKTALDPYATFRSLYRQRRAADIDEVRADSRRTIPVWFQQPDQPAPR